MSQPWYSIVPFHISEIEKLYEAFISSFADNTVRFRPTLEAFQIRILNKLHVDPNFSSLHKVDQKVIGFLLHTIGHYNGFKTAYNGGTGIIPKYRGNHLAGNLYESVLPQMAQSGINKVLLEVVTTNEPAIRMYKQLGFQFNRHLKCFKIDSTKLDTSKEVELTTETVIDPKWESFWSFTPGFLDSTSHLQHNLENEIIISIRQEGQTIGYIIFQPHIGRISQIAVHPNHRGSGMGKGLIAKAGSLSSGNSLTIMNIPEDADETITALECVGFKNEVDQYEMELII